MTAAKERSQKKCPQAMMGWERISVPRGQNRRLISSVRTFPKCRVSQANDNTDCDQFPTDEEWEDGGRLLPEKDKKQQVYNHP